MARENRSTKEQALSGMLLVAELVGGFLTILLTIIAFGWFFPPGEPSQFPGPLKAWIAVAVAAPVIFFTAERWAGLIPGFFLLRGIFGGAFYAAFPRPPGLHSQGTPRMQAVELVIYSVVVLILLWRFVPPRRYRATVFDRTALTIYALSVASLWAATANGKAMPVIAGGIVILFAAWLQFRFFNSRTPAIRPRNKESVDRV